MVGSANLNIMMKTARRAGRSQAGHTVATNSAEAARELNRQHERLGNYWKSIRVEIPVRDANGPFRVGEDFRVSTVVHLGELKPEEVDVELYYGSMKSVDTL